MIYKYTYIQRLNGISPIRGDETRYIILARDQEEASMMIEQMKHANFNKQAIVSQRFYMHLLMVEVYTTEILL